MTRQELGKFLNISDATLAHNFKRTREAFLNRGISIWKEGYGNNAEFFIEEMIDGAIERYRGKKYDIVASQTSTLNIKESND